MTFNFIFRQGLPENVFITVINNNEIVLRTISLLCRYFYKDVFLKSLTKHKVKGHLFG